MQLGCLSLVKNRISFKMSCHFSRDCLPPYDIFLIATTSLVTLFLYKPEVINATVSWLKLILISLPGIIDGAEAAMANFTEIIEQSIRIFRVEKRGYIGVLEAARPEKTNKQIVVNL